MKRYELPNGITAVIGDHTRRYFAQYFTVEMEIAAEIPVEAHAEPSLKAEALELLGPRQVYLRKLSRQAVYEADLDQVKKQLVDDLEKNAMDYLASTSFPARFVAARLKDAQKRRGIERLRDAQPRL